jgi:hypothetical protein
MAKFRIRLKVQALELEVDGERQDMPAISAAVQQQMAGLVRPAMTVADGKREIEAGSQVVHEETAKPKSRPRRRTGSKAAVDLAAAQPLDFRHEPAKYANPQQAWNITDKAVWLLHVLKDLGVASEVSGPQLAATFNYNFKATGAIRPPLVTRELARAKVKVPALVGEDKTHDPSLWYVTDEGTKHAQQLIQTVLNPA